MPMPDYRPPHPKQQEAGHRVDAEMRLAIHTLEARIHELESFRATATGSEADQLSAAVGRLEKLLALSRQTQTRLEAERQAKE